MNWFRQMRQNHLERKIVRLMIQAMIAKQTRETIIIEKRPEGCLGYDCDNCRCDLAPDCD